MAKLFLKRVENAAIDRTPLLFTIYRTAQLREDTYQQHIDLSSGDITKALCMAAVIHPGSSKAAELIIS